MADQSVVSKDPLAAGEVFVTVDLIQASLQHIDFLRGVNQHPEVRAGPGLLEAIRRYEQCWLPLAASHTDQQVAPPLDVHWPWHCHMLAPHRYVEDCQQLVGTVVDHRLGLHADKEAIALGRKLWTEKYPEEPFDVTTTGSIQPDNIYQRKCSYNIENASGRQSWFYYQVALPHYLETEYLDDAFRRYCRFLFMKKSYPKCFVVPTYEIDLMWHSHQLFPSIYKADTEATLGHILNHDDAVNDRSSGSKLLTSFEQTKTNWRALYGEVYSRAGGMYRGPPPEDFFTPLSLSEREVSEHLSLKVQPQQFQRVTTYDDLQSFWGPLPVVDVFPPACSFVATHDLISSDGESFLTARVAHSEEKQFRMSAIQVHSNDKMAAMAHMVALEQLPCPVLPTDTMLPVPVLRYQIGERAVLIKDNQGDWGLCFGSWSSQRKPFYTSWFKMFGLFRSMKINKAKEECVWKDDRDEFHLRFYKFQTSKWTELKINRNNWSNISVGNMTMDMDSGIIKLDCVDNSVAQNICLGFSLGLLLALTRTPPGCVEGAQGPTQDTNQVAESNSAEVLSAEDGDIDRDQGRFKRTIEANIMLQASGYFVHFQGRMA